MLDPDGLNFPERIPLLIGHCGEVPGHAFDVRRDGDGFAAAGYAGAEHWDALFASPYVSPGFVIRTADSPTTTTASPTCSRPMPRLSSSA